MRTVTILGATGSIGQQTLEVVRQHRSEFEVRALTARRGSDTLAQLCVEFEPEFAVVADEHEAAELRRKLETSRLRTSICSDGNHSELDPVFSADVVVTSIVGGGRTAFDTARNSGRQYGIDYQQGARRDAWLHHSR